MSKDLDFIKAFSKIKIAPICKKLNVDKSNLWAGKVSAEKVSQVKEEIKKEINNLELKYLENEGERKMTYKNFINNIKKELKENGFAEVKKQDGIYNSNKSLKNHETLENNIYCWQNTNAGLEFIVNAYKESDILDSCDCTFTFYKTMGYNNEKTIDYDFYNWDKIYEEFKTDLDNFLKNFYELENEE